MNTLFDKIFKINKKEEAEERKVSANSISVDDDGAIVLSEDSHSVTYFDFIGEHKTLSDLIKTYRNVAMMSEVDYAINDIVNECIVFDDDESNPVRLDLSNTKLSDSVKKKINEEFENILDLMEFKFKGFEDFKQSYIDGRIFLHKIIDENNPRAGIIGIRRLDAAKTTRVREVIRDQNTGRIIETKEYIVYDENLNKKKSNQSGDRGLLKSIMKFPVESIAYTDSGIIDPCSGFVISHLQKAIKPANMLSVLEDSTIVHRLVRAPQRRVFYVDVGNMQKNKAEEYVNGLMKRHRKKMVYDADNGNIIDRRHNISMQEDIWLPRKNGKGTEVTSLDGDQNFNNIEEIDYFHRKLYKSLEIPVSRINENSGISFGRGMEITRDELKFNKFILRIRKRWNILFNDLLKTQLELKNIMNSREWEEIRNDIKYIYNSDLFITDQKKNDILHEQLDLAEKINGYVGRYFSDEFVMRNIFKMSDEDIEVEKKRIEHELKENPNRYGEDEGFGGINQTFGRQQEPEDDGSSEHEHEEDENVLDQDEKEKT